MDNQDNRSEKSGEGIKIAAGIVLLLVLFSAAAVAFYINRDDIYSLLRGGAGEAADRADKTDKSDKSEKTGGGDGHPAPAPGQNHAFGPSGHLKNVIFLGDSIMAGFEVCKATTEVNGEKVLEGAAVVAAVSYSLKNAVSELSGNSVNLTHEGRPMKPEDIVARLDSKYVFICLGLNDLFNSTLEEYIEDYGKLVKNIRAKSPGKVIAVLSVTPLVAGQKWGNMTNEVIAEANDRLMEFAGEYDLYFIDWAAAIRDENNALHASLSSDGYCHLKPEAYRRLAEYLVNYMS